MKQTAPELRRRVAESARVSLHCPRRRVSDGFMIKFGRSALTVLVSIASTLGAHSAQAQAQPRPLVETRSDFETRAELEAQVRIAEAQHRDSETWLLRTRLEKGDFQEGDRIVVSLHSTAAVQNTETLTVRSGQILQIPKMDDLSLQGVLRSELTSRFVAHLAKYLKDPEVRTTPLIRIAVLGSVGRPGFYHMSADVVLNDVVMLAGGPAGDADLNGVEIRRGPETIWKANDTRTALIEGLSLDRLHLRAGDEVFIPPKRNIHWGQVLTISLSIITLGVTLLRYH